MKLRNYLEEALKKTFQERYAEAQKKVQELRTKKQEIAKKDGDHTKQLQSLDLSINVLITKMKLLQAQQDKKEKK